MSEVQSKILAKGAGVSISAKLGGRGLNFITQVLLARFLGPELFGVYAIGWAILRMVGMMAAIGLDQGVVRFGTGHQINNPDEFRKVANISLLLTAFASIVLGITLFGLSDFIALSFFGNSELIIVLKIFSLAIPFIAALRVVSSFLSISQSMKYSMLTEEISQPVVELLILLAMAVIGLSLLGAVWAAVSSFAIALILCLYFSVRTYPKTLGRIKKTDFSIVRPLLTFSLPISFASVFGSLLSWVDRLLIGLLRGEAEVGIYASVSLVSVAFVTILSGIKVIFLPMIANYNQRGEYNEVNELFRVSTKWGFFIGIPLALIIFFAPVDILRVVFGTEYIGGGAALIILTIAQLVNLGTGAIDILLIMTGYQRDWLTISGIMLLINVFLNLVLIPRYGITGAAISTAATLIITFIFGLLWVWHRLGLWPYDRRFIKGGAAAMVVVLGLFCIRMLNIANPLVNVVAMSLVAFGLFPLSLVIFGLEVEDNEVWRSVLAKMKSIFKGL